MSYALHHTKYLQETNHLHSSSNLKEGTSKLKGIALLKKGIWLYFILIIFEGALRKWILPGMATPLLIIRDPIALWLIILCLKHQAFKINGYIAAMWLIGLISFSAAIFLGHGNIYVALFGIRILMLHFPLMFVIARVFDRQDVIKMGKVLLWITIPMTVLMIVQFYSPQSDWVNRGLGGNMEGAGYIGGAFGFYRPPGTFSFITGLTSFYGFVAGYIFYFWFEDLKIIKKWLLIVATGCLLVSIPFSLSRTLFFELAITYAFAIIVACRKPKYLMRIFFLSIGGVVLLIVLSNMSFFQTGIESFTFRFEGANEEEGGTKGVLVDRFLGGMIKGIIKTNNLPFWGYGVGIGTNTGAVLMKQDFVEEEWDRLITEMGLLLGLAVICLRIALTIKMTVKSLWALKKGNVLPWMLLSFSFLNVLQSQWGQPTTLGFSTLSGGLVLASIKKIKENKNSLNQ